MDSSFQKTVLTVFLVIFVLCMLLIAFSIYRNKYNTDYPPVISDCPDYWEFLEDGSCQNTHYLGSSQCATNMDFTIPLYSGSSGMCQRQTWAKSCGIVWDGITGNNRRCRR
jgi:hypothetical protein